jgi:hypothetical protein
MGAFVGVAWLASAQARVAGLAFAAAMLCITWIQQRYTSYSVKSSEELSSASHALKPAFIGSFSVFTIRAG